MIGLKKLGIAKTVSATKTPSRPSSPIAKKRKNGRKAIVFVHGIISWHKTFNPMKDRMIVNGLISGAELYYFDYPYNESMDTNGDRLASALCNEFSSGDDVAIVAHSMGGLVSRFAIISRPLEFVRILFLLGTPNAGAMRLSQLTALAQLAHLGTNRFFTLFPRCAGIPSLSNAASLIEAKRGGFGNALAVDYVSIPGKFYHQDRNLWKLPDSPSNAAFSALEAVLMRISMIRMTRPHDGIVEESSNNLALCPRDTEKLDSYGGYRGGRPATYAHLTLAACREVSHVQIHTNPDIIDLVTELIALKFDASNGSSGLEDWLTKLPPERRLKYGLQVSFDT